MLILVFITFGDLSFWLTRLSAILCLIVYLVIIRFTPIDEYNIF